MKKIFLLVSCLAMLLIFTGCNEMVNINFIIGAREQLIKIEKKEIIKLDYITIVDHEHIVGMFYDSDYIKEYKDEQINKDITIYVKVKDGSKYLMSEQLEKEILDIAAGYPDSPRDYVCILYYFGEYNGIHILMLKDLAGYPGDGENHGLRKIYYYNDGQLYQIRVHLEKLIEQGYFTEEDYYEFRKISERIFEEVYG